MPLIDVKDHYYWYCVVGKMSEDVFWNKSIAFVNGIIFNENSFKNWLGYQEKKERRRNGER